MPIVGRIFGGLDFSNWFIALGNPPAGYSGPQTYEALTKAGVPLFAYGNFITVAINFLILAFIIFLMVKQINRLKRETPPAPPAAPPEDVLLREIRDACEEVTDAARDRAAGVPYAIFIEVLEESKWTTVQC
jgi:large conductance mechanosensitive channel